jgi:translation elongation factor EF-Tu-like GTPase
MQLLMKIEDTFMIRTRGLVIVGLPESTATYKVGDKVVVVKPSGHTEHCTTIKGIEMFTPSWQGGVPRRAGILLEVAPQDDLYLVEGIANDLLGARKELDAHSQA